jgi:hypothetical protein
MAPVVRSVNAGAMALGCDRLPDEADPYQCAECMAVGDSCAFHAGFAAGWDACMGAVADWVNRDE